MISASKRPRPFSPGNENRFSGRRPGHNTLQRGPGRSAREISQGPANGTVSNKLQRGPGRSAREIIELWTIWGEICVASKRPRPFSPGNRGIRWPAYRIQRCFKEAQAVQPGKCVDRRVTGNTINMLQRGPGRSAREILYVEGGRHPTYHASKRPRPFSPGNNGAFKEEVIEAVLLQRGPGRSAREIYAERTHPTDDR